MTNGTAPTKAGEELWGLLQSGEFSRKSKQAKRAKQSGKKEKSDAILRALGLPAKVIPSPWKAIAIVLPVREIHCKCGSIHRHPAGSPLVRFQHKSDGSIWEVDDHPSLNNASLPREHHVMCSTVTCCQDCFQVETVPEAQFDLFTIYVKPEGRKTFRDHTPANQEDIKRTATTVVRYEDIIQPFFPPVPISYYTNAQGARND